MYAHVMRRSTVSDSLTLSSVFFFSSRRRHTRFDCDWSSDVCSSDLMPRRVSDYAPSFAGWNMFISLASFGLGASVLVFLYNRSEERRVGKEGRSRGWPYH